MDRQPDKGGYAPRITQAKGADEMTGKIRFCHRPRVCCAFNQHLPLMVYDEDALQFALLERLDGLYTHRKGKKVYREEFVMHFFRVPENYPPIYFYDYDKAGDKTFQSRSLAMRVEYRRSNPFKSYDELYQARKVRKNVTRTLATHLFYSLGLRNYGRDRSSELEDYFPR